MTTFEKCIRQQLQEMLRHEHVVMPVLDRQLGWEVGTTEKLLRGEAQFTFDQIETICLLYGYYPMFYVQKDFGWFKDYGWFREEI